VREPEVSVIVPVWNNPEGIAKLLACLRAQTVPRERFEVVIADDGSDRPPAIDPDADGWLQTRPGPRLNSYAARNRAVTTARGQVLAFCDSDCQPEPTWLDEGLAALETSDVVAGEVRFDPPQAPSVWSLLTVDMFLDQERSVQLSRAVTANLFLRRSLYEDLGGFDDSLPSGGDYDLVVRAVDRGARLAYAPDAVVLHPTVDEARPFLEKVYETNRCDAYRRARAGLRPELTGFLLVVPPLAVAYARRKALRPIGHLHRGRLRASGMRASWREDARALPVVYFPIAIWAGMARVRGWTEGMRMLRRQPAGAP
jgi:glycosyltransferase involved in cell wall biosynthesis